MSKQPSICIVLPNIYAVLSGAKGIRFVGGAELQHTIVAKALAQSGYKVSVVCLDHGQPDGEIIDGVQIFKSHRPAGGVPVIRFFYPRLLRTWQAMKRANADIYYQPCAAYLTGVVVAFCRVHGKKSVFAGASDTDFIPDKLRLRSLRDRVMYRWGLRHADAIVAQTPKQQRLSTERLGRVASLIPNGYALPSAPESNRREYVLWVGSIRQVKRPERFLEIARKMPHQKFRMIGGPIADADDGGAYYEGIKAEAARIPNLEFLGFIPYAETEPHFDHAAVFVNTSDVEGFPNTFLQAWARGVPTVSYFDPALTEADVFRKVGDIPQAVSAIESLLRDADLWQACSVRCKAYFQRHHAIEAIVQRYADLFGQLMGGATQ
jgi:glycosyltransferase involved in cell wall biosynthesis